MSSLVDSKRTLVAAILLALSTSAFADRGPGSSGGGDPYTLDFVWVATQKVYPWLVENGAKLSPPVNAGEFLLALNPKDIESRDRVFESCDGTQSGREVPLCYNSSNKNFYVSRALYPLNSQSPSKTGVVAHEIFRKMGIEGDDYEVTKQMSIARESETKILRATQVLTTPHCHANQADAQLELAILTIGQGNGDNPACQKAVSEYYQTATQPFRNAKILQTFSNRGIGTSAPNGQKCGNGYSFGWIAYQCTIEIEVHAQSAQVTDPISSAVVNPNVAITSVMSSNDKSTRRGISDNDTQKSRSHTSATEASAVAHASAAAR